MRLFLSSAAEMCKGSELYDLREITHFEPLVLGGQYFIRAEVNIPVTGQSFGLGGYDPTTVYLADRLASATGKDSIKTLQSFPMHVYVGLVKDQNNLDVKSQDDLQIVSWANLYDNEEAAQNDIEKMEIIRGDK